MAKDENKDTLCTGGYSGNSEPEISFLSPGSLICWRLGISAWTSLIWATHLPTLSRLDEGTAGRAREKPTAPETTLALPFSHKRKWEHQPSTRPEGSLLAFLFYCPQTRIPLEKGGGQGGNQDGHISSCCATFLPNLTSHLSWHSCIGTG